MIDKMMKDRARFVPESGFNVVGVDTFEEPGEQLYLVGHYEDADEAERVRAKKSRESTDDRFYVYGPNS